MAIFTRNFLRTWIGLSLIFSTSAWCALSSTSLLETQEKSENSEKPRVLDLSLGIHSNSVNSTSTSGTVMGIEVSATHTRTFSPTLKSDISAALYLETGAVRAAYADEFLPRQVFRLRQARFHWSPEIFTHLKTELSLGAHDENSWNSHFLFQNQSFPGARQLLTTFYGRSQYSLEMEQAVVADTTTRQPWGNWNNQLPSFFMEEFKWRFKTNQSHGVSVKFGHFSYYGLSQPSAYQAQFLGNTVEGNQPQSSRYIYPYQGFHWGTSSRLQLTPEFALAAQTEAILNPSVPADRRFGWRGRFAPQVFWSPELHFTPHIEYFFLGADATVALYQPRQFGHANRKGFSVGLDTYLKDPDLTITAEWIESSPILPHPWQTAMRWVGLSLKTGYEIF